MDLFGFSVNQIAAFFFVFLRTLGIFSTAPIFSNKSVTPMIRICLALALTLTFVPMTHFDASNLNMYKIAIIAIKEVMVGLIMGYLASLMFQAIEMAGAFIDLAAGLGFASMVDPMTQNNTSVMGQFHMMVATLVFLAINAHHLVITGLADSFGVLPLGHMNFSPEIAGGMLSMFATVFMAALKISAPIIGVVFLTDIGLGIIARTVPQLNVFFVGLPAKLGLAIVSVIIILPVAVGVMTGLFYGLHKDLLTLVKHLAG